jgi:hypothetical protein
LSRAAGDCFMASNTVVARHFELSVSVSSPRGVLGALPGK